MVYVSTEYGYEVYEYLKTAIFSKSVIETLRKNEYDKDAIINAVMSPELTDVVNTTFDLDFNDDELTDVLSRVYDEETETYKADIHDGSIIDVNDVKYRFDWIDNCGTGPRTEYIVVRVIDAEGIMQIDTAKILMPQIEDEIIYNSQFHPMPIIKYEVRSTKNGFSIDLFESETQAKKKIEEYEETDKKEGNYEDGFYEIDKVAVYDAGNGITVYKDMDAYGYGFRAEYTDPNGKFYTTHYGCDSYDDAVSEIERTIRNDGEIKNVEKKIVAQGTSLAILVTKEADLLGLKRGDKVLMSIKKA